MKQDLQLQAAVAVPRSEAELMAHADGLAGRSLAELAQACDLELPENLRRTKGFIGQLLEVYLGANAASRPVPDFMELGVELKTLPLDHRGLPKESTFVATLPMHKVIGATWESCEVKQKLTRVLWFPIQAQPDIPLAERCLGTPLLWSPTAEQEAILRQDWEELMELVALGQVDKINARMGEYLQIRPKAADAKSLCQGISATGEVGQTLPRGFYLRARFTAAILAASYL